MLCSTAARAARCYSRIGFATWALAVVASALVSSVAAPAQPTGPLVADRLLIQGARLSVAPGDEAQTLNVAETATVRTCYAGVCGSMSAGDSRVAGLVVKGELSGPELSEPMTYTAIPGGAFVLPGFQAEGTYLLANLRLVRAESGEILGNATPGVAVLEVRNILLASATVRHLTLDELRARGIEIPILPGIVPVQNFRQTAGFARKTGASVPQWLADRFEGLEDDVATRRLVAAAVCAEQVLDLIDRGATDLHFYTMNKADLVYAICHLVGLKPEKPAAQAVAAE